MKKISKKTALSMIDQYKLKEIFVEGDFCTGSKSFKKYENFPCRYEIRLERRNKNLCYYLIDAFND